MKAGDACFLDLAIDGGLADGFRQIEPGASADDSHFEDEVVEVAVATGVVKLNGAEGAIFIDIVCMADGGVRLPGGSGWIAELAKEPVKAFAGLCREFLPVRRMGSVVTAKNEAGREVLKDGWRDIGIRSHINQAAFEEGGLAAGDAEIGLMILRGEIDGRAEVDVGILKVDIGIGFKAMFSTDETTEVGGIQIREKGNGFNRIHELPHYSGQTPGDKDERGALPSADAEFFVCWMVSEKDGTFQNLLEPEGVDTQWLRRLSRYADCKEFKHNLRHVPNMI